MPGQRYRLGLAGRKAWRSTVLLLVLVPGLLADGALHGFGGPSAPLRAMSTRLPPSAETRIPPVARRRAASPRHFPAASPSHVVAAQHRTVAPLHLAAAARSR